MAVKYTGPTGIDPTQYGIGNGSIYTGKIYNFINGITCFHGLAYKSSAYRDANLLKNPLQFRYLDNKEIMGSQTVIASPGIGQRANIYEDIGRQIVFLDDFGGLSGYTRNEYGHGDESSKLHKSTQNAYDMNRFNENGEAVHDSRSDIGYGLRVDEEGNVIDSATQSSLKPENYQSLPEIYQTKTFTRNNGNDTNTYEFYDEVSTAGFYDKKDTTFGNVEKIGQTAQQGLLEKTNALFRSGKINTLINRFSSIDKGASGQTAESNQLQTAVNSRYGVSRGRNLLKDSPTTPNGYTNPYCRVWTSHKQMSHYKDLIRPMYGDKGPMTIEDIQKTYGEFRRPHEGNRRLSENSVIDERNGMVRYTPYSDDYDGNFIREKNAIKRCMFSIENLAWKDIKATEPVFDMSLIKEEGVNMGNKSQDLFTNKYKIRKYGSRLSKEQTGPNGGRIMWFPPYDLSFSENVNVSWENNEFIGRGEPIYTYKNTERSGTLDFTILIDHPMVIDPWVRENPDDSLTNEEKILRFFAGCGNDCGDGCGNLTLNPVNNEMIIEDVDAYDQKVDTEIIPPVQPEENPVTPYDNEIKLVMPVFFPNGYSAADYTDQPTEVGFRFMLSSMGENGYETCIDLTSKRPGIYFPTDKGRYYHTKYDDTKAYGLNTSALTEALREWSVSGTSGSEITQIITSEVNEKILALVPIDPMLVEQNVISFNEFWEKIHSRDELIKYMANILTKDGDKMVNTYLWDVTAEISGFASEHGDVKNNEGLYTNRAQILKRLMIERGIFEKNSEGIKILPQNTSDNIIDVAKGANFPDRSHFIAKIDRHAVVTFTFNIKRKEQVPTVAGTEEVITRKRYIPLSETKIEDKIKHLISNDRYSDEDSWDNEYKYFNRLKAESPLVFKRITEKFKYFDPAFHSITPEGFNGRLNFLHQCTRQGPTIASSDSNGNVGMGSGNLSFGRPPFCILRIGDFFHTKICINSMSITYDTGGGIQWDMNPEGIGVQPMMAKISLGITFLGGSDIEGPIEKLQNAVTSNYYANTSIYDKNADRASQVGKDGIQENNASVIRKSMENLKEIDFETRTGGGTRLEEAMQEEIRKALTPTTPPLAIKLPTSTATSPEQTAKNKKRKKNEI